MEVFLVSSGNQKNIIPENPVNPVYNKQFKIESIPFDIVSWSPWHGLNEDNAASLNFLPTEKSVGVGGRDQREGE